MALTSDPGRQETLRWLAERSRSLLDVKDGDYDALVSNWSEEGAQVLRLKRTA